MNQSFTTFSTTVLCHYSRKTGEWLSDHIAIITPCPEEPHNPKIWVLNKTADGIMTEKTIEMYLQTSEKMQISQMEESLSKKKEKKDAKKKGEKKKKKETENEGNLTDRKGSTGSLDGEITGNISCIKVREMKRKNP
jgi:hypothetical protein